MRQQKKTGRRGMDLWHILVLAVVRHATAANWDRLLMMANYDMFVRDILGVGSTGFSRGGKKFEYQNILDNVSLIDEGLLHQINDIVVEAGHQLVKKKDHEPLELALKTDSYAVETNIHFPTDLNLLWDSCRKCLDTVKHLQDIAPLKGWRKIRHIRKTLKSQFRRTSQQVFKGKSEKARKESVQQYLCLANALGQRCQSIVDHPPVITDKDVEATLLLTNLMRYVDYTHKFTDQIERRLLQGENIPAEEKIYSIFEPHTEWITKGKQNKRVELGHLLLITTDQYQFIVDYKIIEGQKDASQIKPLVERLSKKYAGRNVSSHSFDKGFWSKDNLETLRTSWVQQAVLPKRGKHTKDDRERESSKDFKTLRNRHSAVESNVNMLEHHGLNRCMDKGLHGFKRCVGLSVLAYNLHILGNALVQADRKQQKQNEQRQQRHQPAA